MNVIVTKITAKDVDEVYEIEASIHPEHHWSKNSFYNEVANKIAHYFCIKDENNKILAFIGTWHILEELHITTLGVRSDYRRLQLAQILMVHVINYCYKNMVKYITLEVRESNSSAISLYKKFLFDSIGVRKNYYQDNGENAVIMFTQNIWYDTFKNNFRNVKEQITVNVYYDE